jgi:hypothetical protein
MIRTERYQFSVDAAENFCVRMEGVPIPMGQYAGSKGAVLPNAQAMSVGMFGHRFFCGMDEVRVVDSVYDESAGVCHVIVQGPVGSMFERQVHIPRPLWSVMEACETICVSGCCGLDAFDVSAAQIHQWAEGGNTGELAEARTQ